MNELNENISIKKYVFVSEIIDICVGGYSTLSNLFFLKGKYELAIYKGYAAVLIR